MSQKVGHAATKVKKNRLQNCQVCSAMSKDKDLKRQFDII
jgi:hypothetical protein